MPDTVGIFTHLGGWFVGILGLYGVIRIMIAIMNHYVYKDYEKK